MLSEYLKMAGCEIIHSLSSKEGMEAIKDLKPSYFDIIFTDITMETHVSGILLVPKIRWSGYKNCLVIYSTGFNYPIVLLISKIFFKILGADGLLPKDSLKAGDPKLSIISKDAALQFIKSALTDSIK